jgi:uncharacterized protein
MPNIILTGGTGLVGSLLAKKLAEKNYQVTILTRSKTNIVPQKNIQYSYWNVDEGFVDDNVVKAADAIIHLAGAGVMDKPWSDAYKQKIEDSRVKSMNLLLDSLKYNINNCSVVITASAIGWYGKDIEGKKAFTENDAADTEYLGRVCKKWEAAAFAAEQNNVRVVALRMGIVLSKTGGAYTEFRKTVPFGLASIIGNGKQMVSWIHIDDVVNMYLFALENKIAGSYNCTAPKPVSNGTLVKTIAKTIKGRWFISLPVPTFILKLMLGERAIEILKSTTVGASKIEQAGFKFLYRNIEDAVQQLERAASSQL